MLDEVSDIAAQDAWRGQVIGIAGISALDNNASLANAGVAYVILKDWDARGPGEDLRSLYRRAEPEDGGRLSRHGSSCFRRRRSRASAMPPASPCSSQLRDGNADFAKLQADHRNAVVGDAQTQSALQRVSSPFRSDGAAVRRDRRPGQDPDAARHHRRGVLGAGRRISGRPTSTSSTSLAALSRSMLQADSQVPPQPRDIENLTVRNQQGDMVPLGTLATITPAVGPSLISLYNLYPILDHRRPAGAGLQFGPVDRADGGDRRQDLAARHGL